MTSPIHYIYASLRKAFLLLAILLPAMPVALSAQMLEPVKFTVTTKRVSPQEIDVTFKGKIDKGWHVYSVNVPSDGPTVASFSFDGARNVEKLGKLRQGKGAIKKHDPVFGMDLEYFENSCVFTQRLKLTGQTYSAKGYLEYGACDDKSCMPPMQVEFSVNGNDGPADANARENVEENIAIVATKADSTAKADTLKASVPNYLSSADSAKLWTPEVKALNAQNGGETEGQRPLLLVFFLGFLGGLVALLTPCVWPIIPMTVSFFLHRKEGRRKAVRDAVIYGLAIIVIYLALGIAVTTFFGANAMNSLSTNAVFNIFFFLLLVVFAASFLGGFDITLPSSWGNAVNSKSRSTTGVLSIFLMALTLVLVSFSCTGPIIGFLLVEVSTYGKLLAPAVGMLGFAIALALPFALFAMFPSFMQKMPKSGSWMDTVKVTLGFIELAFSLKFLSVADLAYGWHILDRETFLALWIAIALVLGLYLLGVVAIHGDRQKSASVPRVFLGLISIAFAIYMLPGLWGAPLRAVSAFAPPMSTQDFRLGGNEVRAQYTDYETGMAAAAREGKPVLLDFTGFGCVNCRKMEASVWIDPKVSKLLNDDFILISLFVDDKTRLPKNIEISQGGKKRTLRTVGDKWSWLQQVKFGANAQPFYVAVDTEGRPLAGSYAYDEDVSKYAGFLQAALDKFKGK